MIQLKPKPPSDSDSCRRPGLVKKAFLFFVMGFGCLAAVSGASATGVDVPAEMRACVADADCGYVETTCSSCCGYVAINRDYEQVFYDDLYAPACAGYSGAVCDCIAPQTVPACREGACVLEPCSQGAP